MDYCGHFEIVLNFSTYVVLVSTTIKCADSDHITPDMHDETGQPIYFLKGLLNVVVLQKTESSFMHSVSQTKQTYF